MIDLTEITQRTNGHSLVVGVDQVPKGHIRMETAFLYPDGASIDVFLLNGDALRLSDLGQTTTWLLDMQVRPWLSKKRQRLVEDALRLHGVSQVGGAVDAALANQKPAA